MSKLHYEAATAFLSQSPGQYEIEISKALAALAVADELKTANLIAYMAAVGTSRMQYLPGPSVLTAIQADIEVRLGLA